jgi:hypothetical protein
VISAVNRIVAAAGQMSATVQIPFLTLCDAAMGVSSFFHFIGAFIPDDTSTVPFTFVPPTPRSNTYRRNST